MKVFLQKKKLNHGKVSQLMLITEDYSIIC